MTPIVKNPFSCHRIDTSERDKLTVIILYFVEFILEGIRLVNMCDFEREISIEKLLEEQYENIRA